MSHEQLGTQSGHVRLSVNVSPKTAGALKGYAARKEITVTEAVRQAVAVLEFFDEINQSGSTVSVDEGGAVREVRFLT